MVPDILSLALHRATCLTAGEKLLLHEIIASEGRFSQLSAEDVSRIIGRNIRSGSWNPGTLLKEAGNDLREISGGSIGCLALHGAGYPAQLAEIFDPPFLLFYRGELPERHRPSVAVVGTRYPDCAGLDAAFDLAFQAADAGIPVVSGLALGIDTAAHQGALKGGGKTVAVLGCGCDTIYPRSSSTVGADILSRGGCILSEYPPGTPPLPYHFPQRNRIISGLSRGVVVVQAPERSGALITADFALEQGRDLFIHGDLLRSPANEVCRELHRAGAPVITGMSDILDDWNISLNEHRIPLEGTSMRATGKMLALLLEEEISGTLIRYRGKLYRRMYQHG